MSTPLLSDPGVAAFGASLSAITLAELGDRTQLTTIFRTTAPAFSFAGLLAGTLPGHAPVTWLAVSADPWIGGCLKEELFYRLSGGLFLPFGLFSFKQAPACLPRSATHAPPLPTLPAAPAAWHHRPAGAAGLAHRSARLFHP